MNQFESFHKQSTPDNNRQFQENGEFTSLIENAKAKAEGIIMFAPLAEEVKAELLEKLDLVPLDSETSLQEFIKHESRGMSEEETAGLWVNRHMRSLPTSLTSKMQQHDIEMLELAMDGLYCKSSEYSDELLNQWRLGNNPE